MKPRFLLLFSVLILCCFTGCSAQDNVKIEDSSVSGEKTVTTWKKNNIASPDMLSPRLMQDTLYYWSGTWSNDIGKWENSFIYKQKGLSEIETMLSLKDNQLIHYVVDENHNLYCFYRDTSQTPNYFFTKINCEGIQVYNNPVIASSEEEFNKLLDMTANGYVTQGEVTLDGEVCLLDSNGILFLFDKEGQFLCTTDSGQTEMDSNSINTGLVNAGDNGIFIYKTLDDYIFLQEINMSDGSRNAAIEIKIDTTVSLSLFSGYDRGILIYDGAVLWSCQPNNKELVQLADMGDDTISLNAYDFLSIGLPDNQMICSLVKFPSSQNMEIVYIDLVESSELTEKQMIVLGNTSSTPSDETLKLVIDFNKYNSNYSIVIKNYPEINTLATELLKGQGPDILEIGSTQYHILAANGVLADLSPFFSESNVIKESDLLPTVKKAGTIEGKLLFVFSDFTLTGHLVKSGYTNQGGWTPEEFLALGTEFPMSSITPFVDPFQILQFAIQADMNSFIDWQAKECFFNSERFVFLLEQTAQVTNGKLDLDISHWRQNRCQLLLDKEILTDRFWIGSVDEFIDYKAAYSDFAEFAGHPNQNATPRYCMAESEYVLGINNASENKQGAWAFLEYMLSKEYQNSVTLSDMNTAGAFPVRQDVFESYVDERISALQTHFERQTQKGYFNKVLLVNSSTYPKVTKSDGDFIKYMAENAYWDHSLEEVMHIISEETGAFWAGDKTAQEVADIIQNRISLILKE